MIFGIYRRTSSEFDPVLPWILASIVEIVTLCRYVYWPKSVRFSGKRKTFTKKKLNSGTRWNHWIGAWLCLASDLVVLLSFGHLDANWTEVYWSKVC